jgi:precorrin-6B methylase 2
MSAPRREADWSPAAGRRALLRALAAGAAGALPLAWIGPAAAQEYPTPFGPSAADAVARMVKLAAPRAGELVVDLGSGRGDILIAFARAHPGIRAWGVDINADLVRQATQAAQEAGVAERVQFFHRNAFDADLREADVINMWLFANLTRLLRAKILAEARPGARVLINGQLIGTEGILGNWRPDVIDREGTYPIMMWVVPARVDGYWSWELAVNGTKLVYDAILYQQFQNVEGTARVGNRRESFIDTRLRGDELTLGFDLTVPDLGRTRHVYTGRVRGDAIQGTVRLSTGDGRKVEVPWLARRTPSSDWFRPTGVELK